MTLATLLGRLQTKLVTFIIAGLASVIFVYLEDCSVYYTMFALMIVIGLALEAIWGFVITHQPGWLTLLFGALEFSLIFTAIKVFHLDVILSDTVATLHEGLIFYLVIWAITQLFLIYLFPVWYTKWADEGRELW